MQLFTVDQANRTLPLVRRIVEDIVSEHRRWQEALVELDMLAPAANSGLPNPRIAAIERRILFIAREIEAFRRELEGLGIQLKDGKRGLIDFPSELDGRPMLLCWELGEAAVGFWHDEESGYAGRQPLSPTLVGGHPFPDAHHEEHHST
ncbi:MAG: hypothetical protein JWM95_1811 [Gemmatimonadetes bacterium]|nr:hypothetical protein [Gemmatimonadota bacterium]